MKKDTRDCRKQKPIVRRFVIQASWSDHAGWWDYGHQPQFRRQKRAEALARKLARTTILHKYRIVQRDDVVLSNKWIKY